MATKLKNLRISKVDFVDEGANPDAHIKLTKSKSEKGQSTGENGDKNGFVSRLFGFIGKKGRHEPGRDRQCSRGSSERQLC